MDTNSIYSLRNAQLRAVFASNFTNQPNENTFSNFHLNLLPQQKIVFWQLEKSCWKFGATMVLSVVVLMSVGSVLAIKVLKCVTRVVTNNRN